MARLWPAAWEPRRDERKDHGPLILTAALPPPLQAAADALRPPAAAAHAPAHLALFRHLPASAADAVRRDLRALMAEFPAPAILVESPRRREQLWLAPVRAEELLFLRERLAERWHGLLAPGDLARPRLHISLARSAAAPPPLPAGPWRLPGLLLWQYGEACWTPLVALAFRG